MISNNNTFKIRKIAFKVIISAFLLSFWFKDFNEDKLFYSVDDLELKGAIFAADSTVINIKVSLLFNADLDGSGQVDGRDLGIFMFFFGKTENEYKTNDLKVNPDIDGNKIIDGEDLVILASHFGLKR